MRVSMLILKMAMLLFFCNSLAFSANIDLGVDLFFKEGLVNELKGKRIGLVTNHTGVDSSMQSTVDLFLKKAPDIKLTALFAPEHGLNGHAYAYENIDEKKGPYGIPVFSLHGKTRRPTEQMLKEIDVLIYDIQDIGCRSYTYTTTLCYVMEEAAKLNIPVIVLDRPNPINGLVVDGPMLQKKWRSYIGYINVPYCHGMTIGELAYFFNEKYQIGCQLKVIKMKGWKRSMSFKDTGLIWIPTSPYVPESDTPQFYASTGLLGELSLVNIGIGYTMPFKLVGAPWIVARELEEKLNAQKLPGVFFIPFHYRPFYGLHNGLDCQGVMIVVTDHKIYRPVSTQCMIVGILKTLYPEQVLSRLNALVPGKKELFCKASGNEEMLNILQKEKYVAWKWILFQKEEREEFMIERKKFLLY